MIIIDPVALGDVAFTRASPKWVFDRTGALVQVPADTLAVTYDRSDLSKAPYAVMEIEPATKCLPANDALLTWTKFVAAGGDVSVQALNDPQFGTIFRITKTAGDLGVRAGIAMGSVAGLSGTKYAIGAWLRKGTATTVARAPYVDARDSVGGLLTTSFLVYGVHAVGEWFHAEASSGAFSTPDRTLAGGGTAYIWVESYVGDFIDVKLPEIEAGPRLTSPVVVPPFGAPYTRAADVVGPGAGVVYSNIPISEPNYDAAATYAKSARVHDPSTHNVFESLIDANKSKALTDTTAWTPRGATNRWAMLDQYNNTQTTTQDEILLVVSPRAISRGFYIGNVDATEVRISVTDPTKGVVYQETKSLRLSTSSSSFYNWCFNRIRRRSWAVSLGLPPYYGALVTISIRKPGGTVACGMCAVGPTMDLGKTLMGLGAEIKDFSETSFNFDGTSTTKKRNWAKRITADIAVDSDQVEAVYEELARLRQKPIVWVGSPKFGLSIAFGRYSGIKPVIKGATRWEMSAQIEGTV